MAQNLLKLTEDIRTTRSIMDEQNFSLIPATEEDLQYLNPEPQSPELVPATEEDLQYITPEIRAYDARNDIGL